MERSQIAVVIPAYNEADSLERVLQGVRPYGEALVVDDGSSDGTAELAQREGAQVLRHSENRGYDAAINTGLAAAQAKGARIAITFDADGQHDPAQISVFAALLADQADVVIGKRAVYPRLGERIFGAYARLRFGVGDPLCGMKGYRLAVYQGLGHADCYGSLGTELVFWAARRGCRIVEVEVPIAQRNGTSRFGSDLRVNARILKVLGRSLVGAGCF
ncbi:MAG: glycosyltransferase family 2 protein [Myxococcales bacterium]|nr:glycosyltransferase family 2 protein [Myxococcales bacterium]MDD9967346.1 glycosyltransferase family 2 protein [Myxococcales bacterium]